MLSENARKTIDELLPMIRSGQCVPFIGAGLSGEASLPNADKLAEILAQKLGIPQTTKVNLFEIAEQYIAEGRTKQDLIKEIETLFTPPRGTKLNTSSYDILTHIPQLNKTMITTNWDNLLAKALEKSYKKPPVVVTKDLDIGRVPGAEHVVYQIHGSFSEPESFIVTIRDYQEKYRELRNPASLIMNSIRSILIGNVIIYIGYSLQDEYFFDILREIKYSLSDKANFLGRASYMVSPSENSGRAFHLKTLPIRHIDATAHDFLEYVFKETAEFVNRQLEMDLIRIQKEPFVEIYGNLGIGKTRLLQEILLNYKYKDNFQRTFFLDVANGGDLLQILQEHDSSIRSLDRLKDQDGLAIVLDSIDKSKKSIELIKQAASVIDSTGGKAQRVFWSSRYSLTDKLPFQIKNKTFSYPLSAMSVPYIAAMAKLHVELIGQDSWSEDRYKELAEAIIQIAGDGHPGLVVKILEILQKERTQPFSIYFLQKNELQILGQLKKYLHNEIKSSITNIDEAEKLIRLIEDVICVWRGITSGITSFILIRNNLSDDHGSAEILYRKLIDTRLFTGANYPLFGLDPTIRHVFSLYLKNKDPEKFVDLNKDCIQYFEKAISETSEDLQRSYIREWLYHFLTEMAGRNTQETAWQLIQQKVAEINFFSNYEFYNKKLSDEIEKDGNLKSLLGNILGAENTELLCEMILNKKAIAR